MNHFFRRRCLLNCLQKVHSRHFSENLVEWKPMEGLVRCPANHEPLTPISFLERAAKAYRDTTSVVYGPFEVHLGRDSCEMCQIGFCVDPPRDFQWRCGCNPGPKHTCNARAPFCCANGRSNYLHLEHSPRLNYDLHPTPTFRSQAHFRRSPTPPHRSSRIRSSSTEQTQTADSCPNSQNTPPSPSNPIPDALEYENLIASGDIKFVPKRPKTEFDPISINYTSGTTSRPKGVVYNHRGAYLNALATTSIHGMTSFPVYLWTVPMFHCNGWCLTWGLAALGGTNVCIRHVSPKAIFESIALNRVTHMGGAPTVLNMIVNSSDKKPLPHRVDIMTGGAPPPPSILSKTEELGFRVSHLYGLTETYGPGTSCVWRPEWGFMTREEQLRLKARQGVEHYCLEGVDVRNSDTMESVTPDGVTIGEIMFRGNTVMSGYLKDENATREAFAGGWFRSGDLAVKHEDGYIEVKDRLKDIVISGGENVSTVEVETVLYCHPAILEAAVVARPDDHWGQTPCAFVKLKEGFEVNSKEVIDFCRDRLPHYMAPRTVVFEDLPKTSTGKIQKFILREKAKAMGSLF